VPEGHTIHRLARQQQDLFGGAVVRACSPQGRFADGAGLIDGRRLLRTDAYGKHLFHRYEGLADVLHVHLGLYGKFAAGDGVPPEPRGALRLRLVGNDHWTDLRGPTACELLAPPAVETLLARLGPDPLRRGAEPDRAYARLARSRTVIAALLMDQSVLAGIGNVYRAEILYRHRLSPFRAGSTITPLEWRGLWDDLVVLMRAGVRAGRIVTTRREDRDRRSGRPTREDSFYVYRRTDQPCRICGTPVRTQELVGRNLYWCPVCQAD
jgi:endonuclease-8